jgi:hypothetical protein
MKDEKLYTQFGSIRSGFLATPIFDFLTLGGSLARTRCAINVNFLPKFQKFNNLSKTGSFVEIFHQEPKKFCLDIRKNVKFCHFLAIFPTKTRHNFAVVLATSIKVGFKVKYNSYIWWIGQLSKFSEFWCEDIRVKTWNRAYKGNFHLIQEAWFFNCLWINFVYFDVKWCFTKFYSNRKGSKWRTLQKHFPANFIFSSSYTNISAPRPTEFWKLPNLSNITIIFHFEPHFYTCS